LYRNRSHLNAKWLELLMESRGLLRSIQAAGPLIGVQVVAARISAASEIAPAITALARQSSGGVIVTPDALTAVNLGQIITLCNQHHLPS
jgi:hypothetical protein